MSSAPGRKRVKLSSEPKGLKSSNNRHVDIISRDWLLQNEEDWHKPTSFPGSSLRLQEEAETVRLRLACRFHKFLIIPNSDEFLMDFLPPNYEGLIMAKFDPGNLCPIVIRLLLV